MPANRPLKRPPLAREKLERAYRLNAVFDLKAEQQWKLREIGKTLGISHEQARLDLKRLIGSVQKPETIEKLTTRTRPRKMGAERAYFLNAIYDLRKQGYTREEIAEKLKTRQIRRSLEELIESVKDPKTKQWLKKGIKIKIAQRQNQIYNLRQQGYTQAQIARELNTDPSQIRRDLKELIKSVKDPATIEMLKGKRDRSAGQSPKENH